MVTKPIPLGASREDLERCHVIADTVLYRDAARFVQDNCIERIPQPSQIQGLLQYSGSWSDLTNYVSHQAGRDQHNDKNFYGALQRWLRQFEGRLESEFQLVPGDATKKQKQDLKALHGGVLGRQFIQHLVAEVRYQGAQRNSGRH